MITEIAMPEISPNELQAMWARGEAVDLVDVSTPVEHREVRVGFAQNAPIDSAELEALMGSRGADCEKPLYVMCRGGVRSVKVCKRYSNANLVNVAGGTKNWLACGLPVTRDRDVMSLDRQVRIAAGSLVVAGCALASLVHPYFMGVSAFVGAGLVFAGATNTCGMAMLLTKMPWNQRTRSTPETAQQHYSRERKIA